MKVAIHQPQYLPWLGYLDKIDSSDVFILLDTVQYKKHEWQNRNRIRTKDGWQWLTVPVIDRFPERIAQVEIDGRAEWRRRHCQALRQHYAGSPHWEPFGPKLLAVLEQPWTRVVDLNVAVLDLLCEHLTIQTRRCLASTLVARDEATDRLIDVCRAVGGTEYLSGQTGPEYMDTARFAQEGIRIKVQRYRHPEYRQRYSPFISHLSVVDMILNCGPESLSILRSGRCWEELGL